MIFFIVLSVGIKSVFCIAVVKGGVIQINIFSYFSMKTCTRDEDSDVPEWSFIERGDKKVTSLESGLLLKNKTMPY